MSVVYRLARRGLARRATAPLPPIRGIFDRANKVNGGFVEYTCMVCVMSTIAYLESIVLARIAEIDARTGADEACPPQEALEDRRAWEKIHAAIKKLNDTTGEEGEEPLYPRYRTARYRTH